MRARLLAVAWLSVAAVPGAAQVPAGLPLKYRGPATMPAITPGDLMTRIYLFADDSLMGRRVGTEYNARGAAYIEQEVRRLGLQPAGENGGYYQDLPLGARILDSSSTLDVGGRALRAGRDFVATTDGALTPRGPMAVVFGGMAFDTLNLPPVSAWRGRMVLVTAFQPPPGFSAEAFLGSAGYRRYVELAGAATMVSVVGDSLPGSVISRSMAGEGADLLSDQPGSLSLVVTRQAAETMLGRALATAPRGAAGRRVTPAIRFREVRRGQGRNVVAILPGSDPGLRGQYLAIGAHNDHIGFTRNPVDHDSILVYGRLVRVQGADSPARTPDAGELAALRRMLDSIRLLRPARLDSIRNGADDDASGSMGLLEIAEAFTHAPQKPRRSILFVWHSGEESGMWGSEHFTDHPTVPRDSIVAQLNIDMIGRGGPGDITGSAKGGGLLHGDDRYLQVLGSRRLSTELGDLIDEVNGVRPLSFRLDYAMDANGHPQNIYCRSDHYSYARYGIPIAFFTTGGHADYHQVTDEPQYIRYEHAAEVARFISEVARRVADLDHRPVLDHPVPNRALGCRQ